MDKGATWGISCKHGSSLFREALKYAQNEKIHRKGRTFSLSFFSVSFRLVLFCNMTRKHEPALSILSMINYQFEASSGACVFHRAV